MSNFNVEDYRQPSDTDSQWEMKKEFMEMYKYIFDKEKLLCLSQAYCDIVLKKSRYPDPVVKVITELSKPLRKCERLLENNDNPSVKRNINEHQKDSEKNSSEHSERPFKQMKFLANEEQANSPFLSASTISQPSQQHFRKTHHVPLYTAQNTQIYSKPEQVLKTPVEHSKEYCKPVNFIANEGQTSSAFLSSLINMQQPSVKQFNSIHSKPLCNDQNAEIYSKSEQVLKAPVDHSKKSSQQMNFPTNEGQTKSAFLSTLSDILQPSVKQFNSRHSKSLCNEQNPEIYPKSEQVLKIPVEHSKQSYKQMNFSTNERQTNSAFLSTLTDILQPSVKQFNSTHSKPLCNEQDARGLSISEQTINTSADYSEKSIEQKNFCSDEEQLSQTILSSFTDVFFPLVEQFRNISSVVLSNEQGAQSLSKSEKTFKGLMEHSERNFKQMDFMANKKQSISSFLPSSTNLLQAPVEHFNNMHSLSSYNEKCSLNLSKSEQTLKAPVADFERPQKQINISGIKELVGSTLLSTQNNDLQFSKDQFANTHSVPLSNGQAVQILSNSEEAVKTPSTDIKKEQKYIFQVKDISIPKENEDMIINALGLPFIKQFAEVIMTYGNKRESILDLIHYASFRCKFKKEYRFEIDSDVDISTKFYAKFFLKDCLIASETAFAKKEAKLLCLEAAINTLVKLASGERSSVSSNPVEKPKHSIDRITDSEKVFEMFSENINRADDEPAIVILKNTASLLDMEDYLAFNVTSDIVSETETEYTCKFFLNDVLVSSAKDEVIQNAKDLAAELGVIKLTNLDEYEIRENELKRILYHTNTSVTSYTSKDKNNPGKTFNVNKALFDSSMKDGVVFLERQRYKNSMEKFLISYVIETGIFCRIQASLKVEHLSDSPEKTKKCVVTLGEKEIGVGVSFKLDHAKTIACTKARINLKRMYYTLKYKDDIMEGFLVTRDQLYNREPYYKNKIKKDFIKCTKLKTWFWFLDISKEDFNNCVEGRTRPITSTYQPKKKQKMSDLRHFADRLEKMLKRFKESQDYCDLLFSWDFTFKERCQIIKMVPKVGLRYQVLIKDESKIVCVRHKYEVRKLLKYLVRHGGCNSKFELIDESETVI